MVEVDEILLLLPISIVLGHGSLTPSWVSYHTEYAHSWSPASHMKPNILTKEI